MRAVARRLLNSATLEHIAVNRAKNIVEAARQDADAIVEAAEAERAGVIEAAREKGFAAGREQGRQEALEEGRAEVQAQMQVLANVCAEAAHAREKLVVRHQGNIVELAVAVAAKLMRQTGGIDADTAHALLVEMLPRTTGARDVKIVLNPEDLNLIRPRASELRKLVDEQTTITWDADEWLRSGNVVVETDRGTLDGSFRVRAQRLVEQLMDVIDYGD